MSLWRRWMQQPQRVWLRRTLFQIHLWAGVAIGLYIAVLSVTGSVLVYRNELDRFFATPRPAFDAKATRLTKEEMTAKIHAAYPGWEIVTQSERITRRNPTIYAELKHGTGDAAETRERLFNPYTGADLGDSITQGEYAVMWIARLHDELLFDREGRYWNGWLSAVMTVIVLTGLVIWWPGVSRWKRSLGVKVSAGWRRINWDLHSALGFWLFLFMLMWGVSGFYLGVPDPFNQFVDAVSDPNAIVGERPGDVVLLWLSRLHFGRWRNNEPLKAAWAIIGVVPAVMFVTGIVMWWNRSLRPKFKRGPSFDPSVSSEGV